jgi:hypothetical protein
VVYLFQNLKLVLKFPTLVKPIGIGYCEGVGGGGVGGGTGGGVGGGGGGGVGGGVGGGGVPFFLSSIKAAATPTESPARISEIRLWDTNTLYVVLLIYKHVL